MYAVRVRCYKGVSHKAISLYMLPVASRSLSFLTLMNTEYTAVMQPFVFRLCAPLWIMRTIPPYFLKNSFLSLLVIKKISSLLGKICFDRYFLLRCAYTHRHWIIYVWESEVVDNFTRITLPIGGSDVSDVPGKKTRAHHRNANGVLGIQCPGGRSGPVARPVCYLMAITTRLAALQQQFEHTYSENASWQFGIAKSCQPVGHSANYQRTSNTYTVRTTHRVIYFFTLYVYALSSVRGFEILIISVWLVFSGLVSRMVKIYFSPGLVEMVTFLACDASAKLPILNQLRLRMRRLFHYSVFLPVTFEEC